MILGVNHQFLYPDSITNEKVHTESLKKIAASDLVDALDCWTWRGETAKEEAKILLDSGKVITYNVGDRFGEEISLPTSPNEAERTRAYDILMREISYALDVNSKKIVFASGPDAPNERDAAKERLLELILKVGAQLPEDVVLSFEPTDWDIDKHFLFGPLGETVDFIKTVRKNGFERIGLLLDQCHVGIMHETLKSGVEKAKDVLNHVHLGNCLLKDKTSPFYGDKHIPWNYPGAEYGTEEAVLYLNLLKNADYFDKKEATASFEMRPIDGRSAEDSLKEWIKILNMAF